MAHSIQGRPWSSTRIVSCASGRPPATVARGQVVDAKGLYLIPGLWDMHTHAYFGWSRDVGDRYVLPLFIANGVTGIRDMGSDLDAVLRARAEVRSWESSRTEGIGRPPSVSLTSI